MTPYSILRAALRCVDIEIGPSEGWQDFYRSARGALHG